MIGRPDENGNQQEVDKKKKGERTDMREKRKEWDETPFTDPVGCIGKCRDPTARKAGKMKHRHFTRGN